MASSMLAIPGYLLLSLEGDFQLGNLMAQGGAGVIQAAEAVNPAIVQQNGGETGVAIKFYKDDFRENGNGADGEFRVSLRAGYLWECARQNFTFLPFSSFPRSFHFTFPHASCTTP